MALVIVMVGALFPAVGDSIGKLDLPKGVATLLGGADYGTITGWMRSEIGSVYGPLVIAYTGISVAVSSTAGEEEGGILALTLAYPIERSRLLLAKAGAVAVSVVLVAVGTLVGLIVGVAVAGGGISLSNLAALALHLTFLGWTMTRSRWRSPRPPPQGRRRGAAAAFALLGFLVNGFAPLVGALEWLKYLSLSTTTKATIHRAASTCRPGGARRRNGRSPPSPSTACAIATCRLAGDGRLSPEDHAVTHHIHASPPIRQDDPGLRDR
jgi:hypothetical protein